MRSWLYGIMLVPLAIFMSCALKSRESLEAEPQVPLIQEAIQQGRLQVPMEGTSGPTATAPRYRIQLGDQLQVSFPKLSQLSFEAFVRPDGYITSPEIGDLLAFGRTAEELSTELSERYSELYLEPRAIVAVLQAQPQFVYIFGEVQLPNRYELGTGPTLLSLFSSAGGPLRSAKLENVLVLHLGADSSYTYDLLDLNNLLRKENAAPFYLAANDVVIVPKTLITDISDFVDQYLMTFLPPIDTFVRSRYYWKLAEDQFNN